ncbi:MAG: FecR family protein [Alphaproteobacteria bacterium]|nr:FecR family protein [Alphaproteobacteria bacterium]MBU2379327.1 FecR family protein [Alphaproteobacteria bacterium]
MIDAQAAAWLARLHGPAEDEVRPALAAWLAEDGAHAAAFERANEAWAILPRAARYDEEELNARSSSRRPRGLRLALAACLPLMLGLGVLWWSLVSAGAYATRPGEQKVATLRDGSRIALNTDTQVDVQFDDGRRRIELDRGEAMFEVAHDAARPFVVVAGDTRVQAIGTVFIVRRTGEDVVVTLIKGKVVVSHDSQRVQGRSPQPVMLRPGERLTDPHDGLTRIEPESVEAATAWRRGQTIFRDTPLGSAVSDLNRYGGPPIVIDDPRVAALKVSGVFATNAADFAEAIAALHGLRVEKEGETLHIVR